jgi:phosphoribosylformylglycinamidine synthase
MITRIEVTPRAPQFPDVEGQGILQNIYDLGINSVNSVRVVKIYKLEGIKQRKTINQIVNKLLVEKLWQEYAVNRSVLKANGKKVIEISRKPGVTDTEIDTIAKAVSDMGIDELGMAGTGKKYILDGELTDKELLFITDKILMNKTVDRVVTGPEKTLVFGSQRAKTKIVQIRNMDDKQLIKLSEDALWLNLDEMRTIQNYYKKEDRDPTDVEIETLAQTWSEHCSHKTFNARLKINGKKKPALMSRLKKATKKANKKWCLSVFVDNAGVIEFDSKYGICGKVETHNSPSAIEPYGGAMTGSGGVFRDIVACGLGAKVLISTDVFCFAPPDTREDKIPQGCLHPQRLLKEVVRGVRDYGNRMGIPTSNGSLHFNSDWRAKPTIIVGSYGIMPKKYIRKKKLRKGDLIVSVGGKTGRDGIHGVTFASGDMTDKTERASSCAVQIGNPIEEKRMFDAILASRDKNLIRFVQDCGGGGYSSAIGEIAQNCGANVYLDRVPLKYAGLASWEIWVSESQERMILIVNAADIADVKQIFADYNVTATVLGEITNNKRLKLFYKNNLECDLDVDFLHRGRPNTIKVGAYKKRKIKEPNLRKPKNYNLLLKSILASWDICSKEPIVRQYDHEVQGTSVLKPFSGKYHDAPNDAVVVVPILGKKRGIAVGHGLNPVYNKIDPYWGSACAIDEAVRNLVAVGVDPEKIALIDNFIWPTPDKESLGDLDRSVDGCCDTAVAFGMPFVSGKDSLSSTYKGSGGTVIKIPPTLCISGFAPVKNIYKTISAGLKKEGNILFIIGETKKELGGSTYYAKYKKLGNSVPKHNPKKALKIFKKIHRAIKNGYIISAHDCSEGGLAVAIAEMCFAGLGAEIDLSKVPTTGINKRADYILFSESNSRFVVEVKKDKVKQFIKLMHGTIFGKIGIVIKEKKLKVLHNGESIIDIKTDELKNAWKQPMEQIFG